MSRVLAPDDLVRGMYVTIVDSRMVKDPPGTLLPTPPMMDGPGAHEPWRVGVSGDPERRPMHEGLHRMPFQVQGVDLPFVRLEPLMQRGISGIFLVGDLTLATFKREMWDDPTKRRVERRKTRRPKKVRQVSRREMEEILNDARMTGLYGSDWKERLAADGTIKETPDGDENEGMGVK